MLSKSEEEKHRLLEENAKLHAQVNLMSPTVGTVEHLNSENTFHEQVRGFNKAFQEAGVCYGEKENTENAKN